MVEIQNLTKYYGHKAALKGVSFTIKENEVLGFLGPNGAGKSTTLNIMAGVIPSTSGTVVINGYDIAQQPVKAKRCIGFLPEIPPIYPDMKVREYLHFAAGLKGIPAVKRKSEVERVMERLKITDVQKRLIRNLSKGYKQRVGFAQALLGDPPVLILDEPTNHLDIDSREWLEDALEDYEGTLIFVSHDRYFVNKFATRIWELENGHIRDFPCGYEKYRSIKEKEAIAAPAPEKPKKERKEKPKTSGSKLLEKQIRALEREIEKQEQLSAQLDTQIEAAASDYQELARLMAEKQSCDDALTGLMDEWERLSSDLEGAT